MAPRLTKQERQAVEDLKALAARWPKSLGIFSDGSLYVMKLTKDGKWPEVPRGGGGVSFVEMRMDQSQVVDCITSIKTDGGDPW